MIVNIDVGAVPSNILIDDVSIKPADESTYGILDCNQLVRNGDAEIGDASFWVSDKNSSHLISADKETIITNLRFTVY